MVVRSPPDQNVASKASDPATACLSTRRLRRMMAQDATDAASSSSSTQLHDEAGAEHQVEEGMIAGISSGSPRNRSSASATASRQAAAAAPAGRSAGRRVRVAMRPRAVRIRKPCWMRNGSSTSSMVPRSSPMAAARDSTPTGPPSNFSMMVSSSRRSMRSKPFGSTSSMSMAARAVGLVDAPAALHLGDSRAPGAAGGWRCAACRARAPRSAARRRRRAARRGCAPSAPRSRAVRRSA